MQLFRPGANTIAVLVMAAIGAAPVLAVGVSYQLMRSPYATDQNVTRNQPVPFSHKHHVSGLGLDCRYCHASVTTSAFAGLPSTHTCMTCHSQIWQDSPMLKPVRDSFFQNRPLEWNRVYRIPKYVYFNHSIHITKG